MEHQLCDVMECQDSWYIIISYCPTVYNRGGWKYNMRTVNMYRHIL